MFISVELLVRFVWGKAGISFFLCIAGFYCIGRGSWANLLSVRFMSMDRDIFFFPDSSNFFLAGLQTGVGK